ncbi:MAG: glutamyl-tRNA reductase [bacterium]|nr:glutamyl-tRNA reductase [bacterium]
MHNALIGVDFRITSLQILEKFHFNSHQVEGFLRSIPEHSPVLELVILSTCNRSEFYFSTEDVDFGVEWLLSHISTYFGVDKTVVKQFTYIEHCDAAVRHLYEVASGVQSMVFGENEILGQLKSAYTVSQKLGSTGSQLNKLFQSAIYVGKHVRDITGIGNGAYSVSSIAIDSLIQHYGDLRGLKMLIVGAGTMSIRAIKKLKALAHHELYISNRSLAKAESLAEEYGLAVVGYETIWQRLNEFDVIYVATATESPILYATHFSGVQGLKAVVDMGVPRNVSEDVGLLPNVTLITMTELKSVADKTLAERRTRLSDVQQIISSELAEFTKWYDHRRGMVTPCSAVSV